MHDPLTVAWEIKRPWPAKTKSLKWRYYPPIVTIWHRDPERRGSDDSCDWFGSRLSREEIDAARDLVTNEVDNLNPYFDGMHPDDVDMILTAQWRKARRYYAPRPWWKHPKYHIHHWRPRVHAVLNFKRWAFSRCAGCGGRFRWGYAPVSYSWHGTGPQWFRGEAGVYHHPCSQKHTREALAL